MDGDLREQGCIRFYQVTGKKTLALGCICSLRWLWFLSRDELEEGLRKGSLKSEVQLASYKVIRIPESGEFLLLELEILGFGIRNSAQGIQNPFNDWTPESRSTQSFT